MPLTILVKEDAAIQYSPRNATYYRLMPYCDERIVGMAEKSYQKIAINKNEEVLLRSQGLHHCHTIVVRDRIYNNYFMMHVSPQALRRPYDETLKKAGRSAGLENWKMLALDFDTLLTNVKKPAYIDLDPYYYDSADIGTHKDSELELVIVVTDEHWLEHTIKDEILATLQHRIPGTVVKTNIIMTMALEHAYYYDVEFNPKTDSLTVISRNGLYHEPYKNAFENNKHCLLQYQRSAAQQYQLRTQLCDLLQEGKTIQASFFKLLSRDISLDQLILNLPANTGHLHAERDTLVQLLKKIDALIQQSKVPVMDLGSANLYQAYKLLGIFHALLGNYTVAAESFAAVADYATNMGRAEYDDDKLMYSSFAGAAFERIGTIQQAYHYYKIGITMGLYLDNIDALLRFSRIASQIEGKEAEALEHALRAKDDLEQLTQQLEHEASPLLQSISQMLERREGYCKLQIDNLRDYLAENHAHRLVI